MSTALRAGPRGPLTLLSSRATERLLVALTRGNARARARVRCEADGGVEVARRLRAGEAADLVVLADDALADLESDGVVVSGSRTALFASDVVLAVAATTRTPRLDTEEDLADVLRAARGVAYSTGPSGSALLAWVDTRGLRDDVDDRLVQAPAGTPVAALLAEGRADVGIQQLSELADARGVRVVGPLPGAAATTSTFAGGILTISTRPDEAAAALARLAAPEVAAVVRAHHMRPAGR